jgi:8-oxo-dGTP pyrophosphatase MutT (NUDIX family)
MNELSMADNTIFTVDDLRLRAKTALSPDAKETIFDLNKDAERGDHDLNPDMDLIEEFSKDARPAAVLVPIVDRRPHLTVLLTQRTDLLPTHAGQISFPGGKIETHDQTPLGTALRETHEEIGLSGHHIEFLGFLDSYQTATGFRIAPAVAIIEKDLPLVLDEREVAEVFEVPLNFLMNDKNHQKHSVSWKGRKRFFYAMPYENRYIWGATAGILRNLYERLYQ